VADRIEANAAVKVLCHHFVKLVNSEHEQLAKVAFEAHPDLNPAEGWRFDGFNGVFVKVEAPVEEPAEEEVDG